LGLVQVKDGVEPGKGRTIFAGALNVRKRLSWFDVEHSRTGCTPINGESARYRFQPRYSCSEANERSIAAEAAATRG
jgi:hypothetical protein